MTKHQPNLVGQKVETCDVLVLGGGPGGSATATLLAEAGLKVVIVEKDRHPRFHIGESLLPHSLTLLDRLGVRERVAEIGVMKPGAEFIREDGGKTVVFNFDRALFDGPRHAYQVRRDRFDHLLFQRAQEAGAIALEETMAEVVSCDDDAAQVALRSADGSERFFEAKFLVDASGRSTVTAKRGAEKRPDPRNTSAAIFGHFRGVPRHEGARGGNIRIYLNDPGWMWQIPLSDGVTSLGLVAPRDKIGERGNSLEAFFRDRTSRNPEFARILENAEPVEPLRATGNFSYRATRAYGPSHIRVGDAYGFIDPIFSTGVHLSLTSGTQAADIVLEALNKPKQRKRLLERYDRRIERRLSFVSWFIYSIHDPAFRHLMLNPRNLLGIEQAVISLLAGDFSTDPRLRLRIGLFKAIYWIFRARGAAKVG
ncbi:MAG: NAD(P)/FAD-dependent oxidoreductase [Pseudomonadota bacterium]